MKAVYAFKASWLADLCDGDLQDDLMYFHVSCWKGSHTDCTRSVSVVICCCAGCSLVTFSFAAAIDGALEDMHNMLSTKVCFSMSG